MSDPVSVTMHWVLTHKSKAQIRAEEESAGRLAAAWSRRFGRARTLLTSTFRSR
jgi:hypothetical protein